MRPDGPTIEGVLTRRRALLLGAGSLVAAALPARAGAARGATLTVAPSDFAGRTSRVLRAPRRFELLGLREALPGFEVRARRRGGGWSRWAPLGTGHGGRGTDPVWTGPADELQLRAPRAPRGPVRVHVVDGGGAPRRRRAGGARAARAQTGPPPIVPRAAWGGDSVPPRRPPEFGQVQVGFVHHTVTANDYAPEQSAGMVLSIARYHRDVNGWNDIGYNFLVDRYGQVFEGRAGGIDQPVLGAQTSGYNSVSTGVAVLGTHDALAVEPAAHEALARLLAWKLPLHGVPVVGQVTLGSRVFERISGHRDGFSTACPGDALYGQLPGLRARAAQLAGTVVPRPQASLDAAAAAVRWGDGARFSGVVRHADGTPAAGERVSLQKQGSGGTWVTVARATADAAGGWATEVLWRRTGRVRARVAGVTTPVLTVAAVPRLGTRSLPRRVRAGTTPLLRGSVRPAVPVTVLVERETAGGRWVTVARVRARRRGTRWEARLPLRRPALYRVTALTGAADGAVRGRMQVLRAVRAGRSLEAPKAPTAPSGGAIPPS